jgi:hypothetical protein
MAYEANPFFNEKSCPCPMHMAVENQIVICPVKLTKNGHPYIRCPECYSVTFVNNRNGEDLLEQLIIEFAKLEGGDQDE